ncbi:MAG: hypothetical protein IPJ32_06360 [Sphingobacteriaceae bacterium]|nr:hypothetical protein [Sphingobacteriaceae bacterium]
MNILSINNPSIKRKKAKSVLLLAFILCFSSQITQAQINFVPNAGFEQLDSCVMDFQNSFNWPYIPIQLASTWDTLKNGGGANPYLCNVCFNPNPNCGVPKNANSGGGSFQFTHGGNGYVYLSVYKNSAASVSWRTYAQTNLTNTLTANVVYCVTYYISLSNRCKYAIDEFGAYFDDGSIASIAPAREAIVKPHIKSPAGDYMKDTLNWMKVQGTYTATGNESYITLGNFKSYAAATYSLVYPSAFGFTADYYVDDVSVIELDLSASAGPDKNIFLGDSAYIGRPPEIGLECTWYNGTVAIGTGAGIWVKPTATNTYVVQQDICGVIKTDTVTVTVQYVGIDELNKISLQSKLYPNPNSGEFNIEITGKQKETLKFRYWM